MQVQTKRSNGGLVNELSHFALRKERCRWLDQRRLSGAERYPLLVRFVELEASSDKIAIQR